MAALLPVWETPNMRLDHAALLCRGLVKPQTAARGFLSSAQIHPSRGAIFWRAHSRSTHSEKVLPLPVIAMRPSARTPHQWSSGSSSGADRVFGGQPSRRWMSLSLCLERDDIVLIGGLDLATELRPFGHHSAAAFEQVTPAVRRLSLAADGGALQPSQPFRRENWCIRPPSRGTRNGSHAPSGRRDPCACKSINNAMLERGLPRFPPEEYWRIRRNAVTGKHFHFRDDFERASTQGHTVFALGLHPRGGNGPDLCVEVDLAPGCADYLSRAGRRQDRKFKRSGSGSFLLPQPGYEAPNFEIGQRSVMFHAAYLRQGRQELIEVATPARGIFAIAIATHRGPIQYLFHSLAHTVSSLRFF